MWVIRWMQNQFCSCILWAYIILVLFKRWSIGIMGTSIDIVYERQSFTTIPSCPIGEISIEETLVTTWNAQVPLYLKPRKKRSTTTPLSTCIIIPSKLPFSCANLSNLFNVSLLGRKTNTPCANCLKKGEIFRKISDKMWKVHTSSTVENINSQKKDYMCEHTELKQSGLCYQWSSIQWRSPASQVESKVKNKRKNRRRWGRH